MRLEEFPYGFHLALQDLQQITGKNWTTVYSPFCLKGLINNIHYDMWFDFVQACIILCSSVISINRLEVADGYLHSFLSKCAELFGPKHCTPNMHLHLHLTACWISDQFILFLCVFHLKVLIEYLESLVTSPDYGGGGLPSKAQVIFPTIHCSFRCCLQIAVCSRKPELPR